MRDGPGDPDGRGLSSSFADALRVGLLTEGGLLLGKATGQAVMEEIVRRLKALPRGSVLLVDLSGIQEASDTALREILSIRCKVGEEGLEERYLVFRTDPANRELSESMESIATYRRMVIPVVDCSGNWKVLGKLTKAEQDTLNFVLGRSEVTSAEVRKQFNLLGSAASNRLRRLHDLGLLKREERTLRKGGGREFIYRSLLSGGV